MAKRPNNNIVAKGKSRSRKSAKRRATKAAMLDARKTRRKEVGFRKRWK